MSILKMSLYGAVMILVIAIFRALMLRRLPKWSFLLLWGAVLVRLLIPFSFSTAFSAYSLLAQRAPSEAISYLGAAGEQAGLTTVWLVGLGIAVLAFGVAYCLHLRAFQNAIPVKNAFTQNWLAAHRLRRQVSVRQSSRVSAPLTYGTLHPVILMPMHTDWEDADTLNYVFAHEDVHIRRFDALWKLTLITALCVHWFNPLVWLMYALACRDLEFACDEAVILRMGPESKRRYALALLAMEERRLRFMALTNGFSPNNAMERLQAVMQVRRPKVWAVILCVALILSVFGLFATEPVLAEAPGEKLEAPVEPDVAEPVDSVYADWELRHLTVKRMLFYSNDSYFNLAREYGFSSIRAFAKLNQGWTCRVRISGYYTFDGLEIALLNRQTGELIRQRVNREEGSNWVTFEAPSAGEYYLMWSFIGDKTGQYRIAISGFVRPTDSDTGLNVFNMREGYYYSEDGLTPYRMV